MSRETEGNAIVYCEGAFNTPNGKTAHGLVRFTNRYRVLSVLDSRYKGKDAGAVLDGLPGGIPIWGSLQEAIQAAQKNETPASHFVVGLAPDGGRLSDRARQDVENALEAGLNVDCGLHDYLSDDPLFSKIASRTGAVVRDIRKPPAV